MFDEHLKEHIVEIVAHIGKNGSMVASYNGVLLIFDKNELQPEAGEPVNAMITHHLCVTGNSVRALIVRPVTEEDILIRHLGFTSANAETPTAAFVYREDTALIEQTTGYRINTVTSGRSPVPKSCHFRTGTFRPTTPGRAYVSKSDIANGETRICGLPTLDDVDSEILAKARQSRKDGLNRASSEG